MADSRRIQNETGKFRNDSDQHHQAEKKNKSKTVEKKERRRGELRCHCVRSLTTESNREVRMVDDQVTEKDRLIMMAKCNNYLEQRKLTIDLEAMIRFGLEICPQIN